MLSLILLLSAVAYLIYKWSISTYDFFEKQNIPFRKPTPFFGASSSLFFEKKSFTEIFKSWYYEYENEKVSGLFEFRRPAVLLRDPEIIKQLTVKDFDHFVDRRNIITEDMDTMFGKSLIALNGQNWKDMRATLSAAFTGSKMRQMFDFVRTVAIQTIETLKKDIESGKEGVFEFKAFSSKFSCDIIASCAFGIEVNSFKNPSNSFFKLATQMMTFSGVRIGLKLIGFYTIPRVMKYFKIPLLDKEGCDFLEEVFYDTMKTRESKGIVRNDMINLLLEAKKGKLRHTESAEDKAAEGFASVEESHVGKTIVTRKWDYDDLAAQCFVFFIAGFETVAQTMSFAAYELACNPDAQRKLYEEILNVSRKNNDGKVTYEQIQSMKFLDQVMSETLRKWPAVVKADRLCVKDYELKYDGKVIKFKKDLTTLIVPIWMIQRDPKFFPEPEKFDPERFSDENKHKIQEFSYLPFGSGPRNCIGNRFALMEMKTIFFYLLLNFTIEVHEKTQIPIRFAKLPNQIKPEKGVWVELKPRV